MKATVTCDKISNSSYLTAQYRNDVFRNRYDFLKKHQPGFRLVQMPSLAILSGQKSAPERIQATDYICTVALSPAVQPKRHTEIRDSTKRSGHTTLIVPKVQVMSTAARDGLAQAHLSALADKKKSLIKHDSYSYNDLEFNEEYFKIIINTTQHQTAQATLSLLS